MIFVALLRGINVGGNSKVEMTRLKRLFENLGHTQVKTYINSGNVIFSSPEADTAKLTHVIEESIHQEFGFPVKVVVVDREVIDRIARQVSADWVNDGKEQKCDVLFLWPEFDSPQVLQQIKQVPGIDELVYFPGAVVWRVWRKDYGRSGMGKLIGTEVYKKSTARNINTVRKLADLMA